MKKPFLISLISTVALACSLQAQTILLSDTFTDGTNPGYTANNVNGVITIESSGGTGTGAALLLSSTTNQVRALRSFSSVTLSSVNDYIELSLNYRFENANINVNQGSTAVLTGSGGLSGGLNFNPTAGTGTTGGTYVTDNDLNAGRFDSIESDATPHSLTLRITRASATELRLTSSFDGSERTISNPEVIGTDISDPLTFNGLEIGWRATSGNVYYDNVLVTTNVPEPSSIALLGLGLGGLFMRRRR